MRSAGAGQVFRPVTASFSPTLLRLSDSPHCEHQKSDLLQKPLRCCSTSIQFRCSYNPNRINHQPSSPANAVENARKPGKKEHHLWKRRDAAGSGQKALNLVRIVSGLPNEKEAVYKTLDEWTAWELEFPLIAAAKALSILRKRSQWLRVIQTHCSLLTGRNDATQPLPSAHSLPHSNSEVSRHQPTVHLPPTGRRRQPVTRRPLGPPPLLLISPPNP